MTRLSLMSQTAPFSLAWQSLWCTGNYALQMMRNKIREPDWQREILRTLPDDRREAIARTSMSSV